jgi:predicted ATPase
VELKRLQDAYLYATEDNETHALTIFGEAGLGKSRLLYEFEKWVDLRPELVRFFRGRATASMTQRPYALLREVLTFRFEIHEHDSVETVRSKLEQGVQQLLGQSNDAIEMAHYMGYLAGFDFSASPYLAGLQGDTRQTSARAKQLFIRFFAQLAVQVPVIIHLDDLHHADEASLDLTVVSPK